MIHYGVTREEHASNQGKHPSCYPHRLRAACGNGDYHAEVTRDTTKVTCPVCKEKKYIK